MRLSVTIILLAFLASPAWADDDLPTIDAASRYEAHGIMEGKRKEIYSIRHPKIYQTWRKTRKACIKLTPVVQFGGAVAQILTAARL